MLAAGPLPCRLDVSSLFSIAPSFAPFFSSSTSAEELLVFEAFLLLSSGLSAESSLSIFSFFVLAFLFLNEYPAACCGWDGQETDLRKAA